ncbi:hypothetical protein N665_0233s0025 [Sinapis alba]|nr:hypothetical protein N665_0233s0025 [Sinapis alba]
MNQIFTGNRRIAADLNKKLDLIYMEMTEKFETLSEHIKRIDSQVVNNAMSIRREDGFLPELRRRKKKNRIPFRLTLTSKFPRFHPKFEELDQTDDLEDLFDKQKEKDTYVRDVNRHSLPRIDRQSDPTIDRLSEARRNRHSDLEPIEPVRKRVYQATAPFPPKNAKQKKKQQEKSNMTKKAFDKVSIMMSLSDVIHTSPAIKQYVKDAAMRGFHESEHCVLMVSEEVSGIIQGKTAVKLPDPSSFVLDCTISNERFQRSLCDLGSSVNLMPYSVTVTLGLTQFRPTSVTLVLADRSTRILEGVLEDVPVRIHNCDIPADFIVLKYEREPINPIILGRPFLATAGAIIDVRGGCTCLNIGKIPMVFDMEKIIKQPLIEDQPYHIDYISNLAEESFMVACSSDPLERAITSPEDDIFAIDDQNE